MISQGISKRAISLELDGQLFTIVDWQHIKMGRGGAIVRIKLRNLRTGALTSSAPMTQASVSSAPSSNASPCSIRYNDGDTYYFMDNETYRNGTIDRRATWRRQELSARWDATRNRDYNDEPLSVDLPPSVDLEVTYTEPGFKGDTATGGTKPATVETGLVVQVPLFVTTGDKIRVKTDTGAYVERVNS